MTSGPALRDVLAVWERRFPAATAAAWDRVGLVCGDPDQPVTSIRFAVDPLPAVVAEAVQDRVDLLITHHPMLLHGVHSVATSTVKGRMLTDMIRAGVALLTGHTNVDVAAGGVSDALADAVGLFDRHPIEPLPSRVARVVCYVPADHTAAVIEAMAAAGAGQVGEYADCAYWVDGIGQFRPVAGAQPHIGRVGELERVAEQRLEMVLPSERIEPVVTALRHAHPYEEPAFHVISHEPLAGRVGMGRHGSIEPRSLAQLAATLAGALPGNAHGVRVAGDPDRMIERVAVCGGSGDSLLGAVARLGVEAYVTSDLRHHPASDAVAGEGAPALLDIAHAAGEHLWLAAAAAELAREGERLGWGLETSVSMINTDPWTFRVATEGVG